MKKIALSALCCLAALLTFAQNKSGIAIIPEPVSVITKDGQFTLPKHILIQAGQSADEKLVSSFLRNRIAAATGWQVTVRNSFSVPATTASVLNAKPDTSLGKEGYQLWAGKKGITIAANQPNGLFYGVQTLLQLLPKEIESKDAVANVDWSVPLVTIKDYPRFVWRGLMLDVSRHFFTKEEVEQYIDQMARYKFNLLHMHLTDDEGWRIEIKSEPRLTTIGAWNVKKVGEFGRFSPTTPDEPRTYGGFYTQNDIKELVQYAKDRFMNIMPEIDVPGHSLAAIVSYPELSCTPGADKYVVRSGERLQVDNTLNPSSEKTYQFLDKVMGEVAGLFPFPYMHLGGDECRKDYWQKKRFGNRADETREPENLRGGAKLF